MSSTQGLTVTRQDKILLMRDAFARLHSEHKDLLWLREVQGYSYEELAHILGIPIGTVRSRLYTAREHLRRIWLGDSQ